MNAVVGPTANAAVNGAVNAADKIGVFADINYGRNNKTYLDEAVTGVQTLLCRASQLLDECPPDHGFDESSFNWFSRVFHLINNFQRGRIVKQIPTEWISVRENIRLFWQNKRYKPANHRPVSFELDLDVHRVSPLFLYKIHIGKKSKTLSEEAKKLISDYNEELKDAGTLYKKKDLDLPPQTEMNSLVSIASEILDKCPNDSGFDVISFDWFIQVMQLIDKFEDSKIVVSIPEPWSRARESIRQFKDNYMYKPAEYTAAPTAPNWLPLARAEGATSYHITQESAELARSAEELKKYYDDTLEKAYKADTLFKNRPRCQLPHKLCGVPFNYRSETMKKLYRSLHDSEPRITLIYGPGGIGKTTILAEMATRAEKEKMFSSVVFVEVSRTPNVSRIQDKIASQLGLKSPLPEGDNNTRSTALQNKMKELERVLVILDDVWENGDDILGVTGVRALSGVKVLVGTRRRDLPFTGAIETIQIAVLSEEESWSFLCQVAPDAVRDDDIRPFAKQVRDECCGLPLALFVIGKALARKRCGEWKRAVDDLKNSIPTNLEEVESALYKVIKYSYDHLATGNKITGKVFLHCCLFPELEEVYVADLQRHLDNNEEVKSKELASWLAGSVARLGGLGLSWLADPDSSSQPNRQRDLEREIAASIDTLEDYGLLEKHRRPRGIIIKMHDVVRDVAVFIAREANFAFITDAGSEKQKFNISGDCKIMSLSNINKGQTDWPELHTLLIRGTTLLPDKFSKKLASSIVVLDLSGSGMKTLPSSMETLINVQTLLLNGCKTLEKVDEIVKLTKLKVLSLRETVVKSLPENMNNLPLEVLYWENGLAPQDADPEVKHEHIQGKYCKLNELSVDRSITVGAFLAITKLNRLTAVKLYVTNSALSSADFFAGEDHLPTCWKKFTIYNDFGSPNLSLNKNLFIKDLPEVKHGVKVLLQEAEEVIIKNCFQNATRSEQSTSTSSPPEQETGIVLTEATGKETLRKTIILSVTGCANIRYLTSKDGVKLTELEEMELASLDILIGIIKPHERAATGNLFGKLRKVIVNSCHQIECVIPNDVHQEVYNTLEVISIRNSKRVKYIFHPERNCSASFSKLTSIELDNLQVLSCIWNGTPQPGIFECLKELIVKNCNRLTSLFTTHMAAQLKNLQKLTVEDNSELTEIASTDASASAVPSEQKTFDCVTHLSLQGLPKLKHFNSRHTNYDWPALVKLNLRACPVLTELPIGENSAKRMNIIDLHSSVDMEWYKNLLRNQEILKHFGIWWVNDGKKHTDPVRRNS